VSDLDQILGLHEATLLKRHNDIYRVGDQGVFANVSMLCGAERR
jgi:hypothetical protein